MEISNMRNKEKQILAAITADKEQPEVVEQPAESKRSKRKRIAQIQQRILGTTYSPIASFLNMRF